jgi:hypothetical protein
MDRLSVRKMAFTAIDFVFTHGRSTLSQKPLAVDVVLQLRIEQVTQGIDAADQFVELEDHFAGADNAAPAAILENLVVQC